MSPRWRFLVDRGGTFTDCVGIDPAGALHVTKVPSSDDAPLVGIRELLGLDPEAAVPPCEVRMGTTLATNALLERKGVPTALVITRGFADLLEVGDQTRPELFSLAIPQPELLYECVVETDARLSASGEVLGEPNLGRLADEFARVRAAGIDSLAIVVMHSYLDSRLEAEIAEVAGRAGFAEVVQSAEVSDEIGLLARGDTAVVDAYLTPLLRAYLARIRAALPGSSVELMTSDGTLCSAERFRGRDAILSGPAAGVIAAAAVGQSLGARQLIAFDMGGTSTDVSRYAGHIELVHESEIAGVRVRTPSVDLHTVAAGGGSICRHDAGRLRVGPESAGATPGPLCYGDEAAIDLALTDVNLALGRIDPMRFPLPLERERVTRALEDIARELGGEWTPEGVAAGFHAIAVENMAEAIRQVSVRRGHDVRDHVLVVLGGAGGQHACSVARRLGTRVLAFHPLAGVLSAVGMGLAEVGWHGEADGGRRALENTDFDALRRKAEELEADGREHLASEGSLARESVRCRRWLELRYEGTHTALALAFSSPAQMRAEFEEAHRRRFGYARPEHPVEVAQLRVEVRAPGLADALTATLPETRAERGRGRLWEGDEFVEVPVVDRESLAPGDTLRGPALIRESTGTIVLERDWAATLRGDGILVCEDLGAEAQVAHDDPALDPVRLELYANRFRSIAEQMGEVLRRTALSTNIRERLDFSCALFDAGGDLVANAPHIPVHLGAMSESVRAIRSREPNPPRESAYLTNDPAAGGSHLPDLTVVSPVHDDEDTLLGWVASRGHHADIGGITPGSMPAFSTTLAEEGVVLRGERIVERGHFDREALRARLTSGRWPARKPDENLADIEAQLAANRTGAERLRRLAQLRGKAALAAYMGHLHDDAHERVREAIATLPPGHHRFEDGLDDGTAIVVDVEVRGDSLTIDFGGTAAEHPENLNAPRAVVVAAILYVLRTLVGHPIPLNAGCLRPVDLVIPPRSLLDPGPERAVAAGNVETSQRVVDVLLGALHLAAASSGTMNNLSFGAPTWGYYETIGGGAGAGPDFEGRSGVHTHMTNTRITDPEILESRFPVRLWCFGIRRGSGGEGACRGGDGLVRELEFLEPVEVALLGDRRVRAPFGLRGGNPGQVARNLLDGEQIGGRAVISLDAGRRLRIETPGAGAFGTAAPQGG